ncbi:glycosyltransferase family 2 protein [Salipiger mucosus]|uniref:Glycosyltransferase 2-like domain-containing protein n=1 Tax=Salipiger mucosus DSM 16094 TaxID=1123237 RepID=S9S2X8_9RHOB|nr:glycosyltransferase family A protein [Salipiger mucosus]EPX80519.1 hypothetical protein Salmuc_03836 [Salipiger mucosus DSM 16094]
MTTFTIVIPCFNAEATLPATLDSLRAQTFTDWEMLIVDDGSTDASREIARTAALGDARITLLNNPSRGPSAARNVALRRASGKLIAFCDADDLWAPEKLAVMDRLFAEECVDAAFARIAFFDERGSRSLSTVPEGPLTIGMLLAENPVCTMSNLVVRRDTFEASGGFDSRMVHNEDLEWLIRLVGDGHAVLGVNQTLVHYRTVANGLSADLGAMRRGRATAIETAARYGVRPDRKHEAVYLRYLARRALRTGAPRHQPLRLALSGALTSPVGFFADHRRGVLTLGGALVAPFLPRSLRRALFSH